MSCPISFQPLKALPSLCPPKCKPTSSSISCSFRHKLFCSSKPNQTSEDTSSLEPRNGFKRKLNPNLVVPMGILASAAEPALAVTGVNDQPDLIWVLIQIGAIAFGYFLIVPPVILNWLRIRWYRRNLLEMYVQFMCVFIFFPGVLLWAPFLNFRKFPRDPTLKYPWSKPENPAEVRGGFLKFPWATIEDYE